MRSTDRHRGGVAFVEKWTNARAALIGFLTGRGWSSEAIADRLADGTSSATIRSMWASWEISGAETALTIPLSVRERANIQARAAQHGISAEEYCHRIVVGASMPRDRYQDIVGSDT